MAVLNKNILHISTQWLSQTALSNSACRNHQSPWGSSPLLIRAQGIGLHEAAAIFMRALIWEFPKIRGTYLGYLIWDPYNKDPTI